MISKDVYNLISELFLSLAKHEREIEPGRQILCESTEFDAHQIFNYLLGNSAENITPKEIIKYLSSNKINITEEEAELIVLLYDQNLDGKLSFSEFINLVRSEKSSLNNKSIANPEDINLSYNINFSLCKLFEKYILMAKSIIIQLKRLQNKYGYNIHDIFHEIKSSNYITSESIKNFLNKTNYEYLESDIPLIMNCLDINKDGVIDLCEFHSFFGFPNCKYICCLKENNCKKCGITYCNKCYVEYHGCTPQQQNNLPYDYKYNNMKSMNDIKTNNFEGIKNNNNNNINILKEENGNIVNEDKIKNISDSKDNNNLEMELQEFIKYIKFVLEGENKIENIKIELAENKEFNVEDTFRLFERNGRGFLDLDDLKYGLGVLSVYPSDFDLRIFLKRFDLMGKGFISFADFYDIVVPFEKIFRDDVEKRVPVTNCKEIILSPKVKNDLKNLFINLIEFENKVNIERKTQTLNNLSSKEIFSALDTNKHGCFFFENFINFIKSYPILDDENLNPDLLFIRMDKKRNGRIELDEFLRELEPL